MQSVHIPVARAEKLRDHKELLANLSRVCKCRIHVDKEDVVRIEGDDPYLEYSAKTVLSAFGRGFGMLPAEKLLSDDYYFQTMDLRQLFKNKKRLQEIKARIIGTDGRTKRYVELVSSAKVAIYGDTVSIIGKVTEISEAEAAIKSIINGRGHRKAYTRMEAAHRRHTEAKRAAALME
jgi:ribosomal RNA assembly protein